MNYIYTELSEKAGSEKLYAGYILRNKTSFQFSKNLFFRVILEYDSFDKRFSVDPVAINGTRLPYSISAQAIL
jgi:hypothetical protein